MSESIFMGASEVAEKLEISKALAYRMIRDWNEELRQNGYTTVQGRVSREYFKEKIYGLKKEDHNASI